MKLYQVNKGMVRGLITPSLYEIASEGEQGNCYRNAAKALMVLKDKIDGLYYCEGYALSKGIWFDHAFLFHEPTESIIEVEWYVRFGLTELRDLHYYISYKTQDVTKFFNHRFPQIAHDPELNDTWVNHRNAMLDLYDYSREKLA